MKSCLRCRRQSSTQRKPELSREKLGLKGKQEAIERSNFELFILFLHRVRATVDVASISQKDGKCGLDQKCEVPKLWTTYVRFRFGL